ncbi:cell division protein FtsL [Betaproteobacteria bacterium]|nr:cell division protein FtsL [Betaproteobacteria bacterium]
MDLGIRDIVLIFLIAASSISLIDSRHAYRVLYEESQRQIQYQQKLQEEITDHKKLLSKLRDKARIESIAENDLNMVPISLKNTITLKVELSK